jgi:hypothetical protein
MGIHKVSQLIKRFEVFTWERTFAFDAKTLPKISLRYKIELAATAIS